MIRYRIELLSAARRQLRKLTPAAQQIVRQHIDALADDPRLPGVRKLSGKPDRYRVRAGDYRIIYRIEDDVLLVLVVAIGDRKDVYR